MTRRLLAILPVLVLGACSPMGHGDEPGAVSFYVAPDGSDSAAGSIEQPFATLRRAQAAVRARTAGMASDIVVNLRGGTTRRAPRCV